MTAEIAPAQIHSPRLFRVKLAALGATLLVANLGCWAAAWRAGHHYPFILASGLLAYGFGLRHAVDADHISAIDNTTRRLVQSGARPVGTGFFFSLGHSTVVILLAALLAASASYVKQHLPQLQHDGGIAGTIISGIFLYLIGIVNLVVLIDLFRVLRGAAGGADIKDEQIEGFLTQRGLLGRLFRPVLNMIQSSWQMYFVGFLFGLGFDTATEIGLLAISARSAQLPIPFWAVMLLPLLFTAGMCLIDSLDGVLMLGAYGWAFIKPVRKLTYNFAITSLSVFVAFVVGTYEMLQVLSSQFNLTGGVWYAVNHVSFDNLGYIIIAAFCMVWGLSALFYRVTSGKAS